MRRRDWQYHGFLYFLFEDVSSGIAIAFLIWLVFGAGMASVVFNTMRNNDLHAQALVRMREIIVGPAEAGQQSAAATETPTPERVFVEHLGPATTRKAILESAFALARFPEHPLRRIRYVEQELRQLIEDPASILEPKRLASVTTWGTFWIWNVLIGLYILCIGAFFAHADDCDEQRYRLADLPWRRGWPWAYALLTAPVSTPFLIVSHLGFQRGIREAAEEERRQEQERAERQQRYEEERGRHAEAAGQAVSTDAPPPPATVEEAIARGRKRFMEECAAAEDVARVDASIQTWVAIRSRNRLEDWERERVRITEHVETDRRSLDHCGREIDRLQRCLADAERQLAAHDAARPEPIGAEDAPRIEGELRRLRMLPAVRAVAVSLEAIDVWVGPVIVSAQGKRYNIGDYRITIPTASPAHWPKVECVTSMRRDGYRGHTYESNGNFCFGDRVNYIKAVLARGEYLPAAALIIEALHHVNPGDERERIVRYGYPEVSDDAAAT